MPGVAPRAAAAQSASPYLPLGHWATPYIEHLITRGAVVDPSPLGRPWRQADILRALAAADTLRLTAGERRVVGEIVADLTPHEAGPWGRADGDLRASVASNALRDPLEQGRGVPARDGGPTRGYLTGSLALQARFGPVVAVSHPRFDTRLRYDPDYAGKKDRFIAGRTDEAYLSAQWRYGEFFFGSLDRNWGPAALDGLLISPSPYSYDHFGITLGTPGLHLEGLITQLDDLRDTTGTPNHRYLVAHRLVLHPPGRTSVALWEGDILAGPGRELEPWYANILTLGLLQEYNQSSATNSLLGADVVTGLGGVTVFGSLLIDDFQIDHSTDSLSGNNEPPSYGITLGAQGGAGSIGWTAFYTRVANLTYRTPDPAEAVTRQGVGLARNASDYDQLTLRGSVLTGPGVLLAPEVTLVRQGQGDFRLPYPAVAQYFKTPTFLAGVAQRTLRLALGARIDRPGWALDANAGVHFFHDVGHVTGATLTRFVGQLGLTWRFHRASVLP
ncbi:MAG TPA: hypothetical protein VI160_01630 [Gemmatimonadales bacterium]